MRATGLIAVLTLMLGSVGQALATPITFSFQFDNAGFGSQEPDGTVGTPVGSGTFTISNAPGVGTFPLASLGAYTMSFRLNDGQSFTQADVASNPSLTSVVIVPFGTAQRVYFSDPGMGAGGLPGGSLDLINRSGGTLSFEPSYFDHGRSNLYFENFLSGNYLGVSSAPEPGSLTLLLVGSLTLAASRWRRRNKLAIV